MTTRLKDERDRRFDALEAPIATRLIADGWPQESNCLDFVAASLVAAIARGSVLRARLGQGADVLSPIGKAAVMALISLQVRPAVVIWTPTDRCNKSDRQQTC